MLKDLQEATALIESGKNLLCAGDAQLLKKLPKGNWIGGTTPYFMSQEGGQKSFDKIFITFKVLGLDNGRDVSVSSSKKIHSSYIKYVESINETREKRFCNITGKEKYCTNKHRGMMGTAKLISASNNLEVYIGRFDRDGNDIVSIAYETSQKIHNMIKYLLENPNSRKWLGGNVYLMTWFSDDVSNDNKIDITEPEDIIFEDDFALDDYAVIGESTKKLIKSIDLGSEFDSSISAYVLILDKVSNGRIAINYFQNLPKSDFANNILHWKSTFNWYFYSKAEGAYIKSTPSNRTTLLALYGVERKGRLEANNDEMLISNNLRLISCILERKKIPLDMYRIACNNIRTRNRYKNTWNNVCAVALAIINKYYLDLGKERMDKTMIEKTVQSRSYVYGRILYLLEYTEKESTEDSSRITNAAKFWNNYVQYPRKTLLNIQNKVQVYRTRLLKSAKAWKLIKIDKEMGECIELLERMNEINSDLNKDKPLNEEFIFGYYAQQTKLFTKNENKETK